MIYLNESMRITPRRLGAYVDEFVTDHRHQSLGAREDVQ